MGLPFSVQKCSSRWEIPDCIPFITKNWCCFLNPYQTQKEHPFHTPLAISDSTKCVRIILTYVVSMIMNLWSHFRLLVIMPANCTSWNSASACTDAIHQSQHGSARWRVSYFERKSLFHISIFPCSVLSFRVTVRVSPRSRHHTPPPPAAKL